jgi:DNA ligase (NAD+)
MYTPDQTKSLQKKTADLIDKNSKKKITGKETEELRQVLRFHEHRYYILNDPLIADAEYDQLFKALEKLEQEDPALITPDSPTQRVARELTKDFPKVTHLAPMLSLDNSYNADDLIDFDRRTREILKTEKVEYCVEPKFDGASISLIYENNLLVRGATRGDGAIGDDITTNIKQVRSVPLSAAFSTFGIQKIEIRGEVLMNKQNFKKFNEKQVEQNLPPLANPRNAAAGSLRAKDPKIVSDRNLEAFLYNIGHVTPVRGAKENIALQTHAGGLKMMWDLGFRSPEKEKKVLKGIDAVVKYCQEFEKERDNLAYEIDGMVIKVNDTRLYEKLGMTSHHPRWAIAYKFEARQGTSKLKDVEFQVGRTGSITPVAKIDPVHIGGVTITSISLFNEDVIREKDLKKGDTVLVERAGDVIPYIVKPLTELRTGKEEEIIFPTNCPVCKDKLVKPVDEAVWRCNNINCEAQVVERIIHFTSKDAMDIRGFGEANVRKFFVLGFLKDVPGIYRLPYDKIRELEGFGEKSIGKLQEAIEASKEQPLHRLIFALGIRYVGVTTAKTLAHSVKHLYEFKDFSIEDLQNLEDIGPKVAGSVYQFFHNWDNIEMLKELESLGLHLHSTGKDTPTGGKLAGQTFLFTGTLPTLKRSDAEAMVEANGGTLLSGVSKNLNFLVAGDEAGSKLDKAKKLGSVQIITEEQFLSLITP